MFVGVSVVLAVFSYLAYRHLYIYADTAGSAGGGSGGPATNASDINTSMSASSSSSSGTTAGKEAEAAAPLSVWPFFSTILRQSQSSLSESSSELKRLRGGAAGGVNGAVCIVPDIHTTTSDQTDARLSADKQKKQQEEESPCTTPRARPVRLSPNNGLTIPMISLDDPDSDNDTPPSFPAMNSAQRAGGGGGVWSSLGMPPPLIPIRNMAPPPVPSRNPKNQNPSMWSRPAAPNPNSAARSRLQVVGAGASGVAAGNGLSLPKRDGGSGGSSSKSRMVLLEPGHSPLDWARLQKSGIDLRVASSPPLPNPNVGLAGSADRYKRVSLTVGCSRLPPRF